MRALADQRPEAFAGGNSAHGHASTARGRWAWAGKSANFPKMPCADLIAIPGQAEASGDAYEAVLDHAGAWRQHD